MIAKVAVLGAGTMGHGIAQLFAQYGLRVSLYDINESALLSAVEQIRYNLELAANEQSLQSTFQEMDLESIANLITYTGNLEEAIQDADLVVEAAPERLAIKHELYRQLESRLKSTALVASNTSSYSLAQLSDGVAFAERMIILHFFNPATLVPLVEIVKQPQAPEEALKEVVSLLRSCGKVPVVLRQDIPGFIANRLQAALLREALYLLESGVADASDIDAAVKHGPGLRWALQGPLETADLGGLDIWSKVSAQLFPLLDVSQNAPELIKHQVEQGNLGVKTGKGIYDYRDNGTLHDRLEERDRKLMRLVQARRSVDERGGNP